MIEFFDKDYICDKAVAIGDFCLLKYLHNNDFPLNSMVIQRAAENGYLGIVKYLAENKKCSGDSFAITRAAQNGHLGIVKYLVENKKWSSPSNTT